MAPKPSLVAPFLRRGCDTRGMMLGLLACLALTAAHYALRYDPAYAWRFLLALALGGGVDLVYAILRDGRPAWPRASTLVTSALLVLSVPARMPGWQVGCGVLVAVLFGKRVVDPGALRLNPMLLGRLFLMLVFADTIQAWWAPGLDPQALTSATPLGLYAAEKAAWPPGLLWLGEIRGNWEGIYALVPGAPGEVMPLLALALGAGLYLAGILDWRPGAGFLAGMAAGCALLGWPIGFELAAGSAVFTAVYIVSDPRTLPGSRFGRLAAGLLAGALNAAIRWYGYYPEGVVLAVLAVNLLTPTLDRLAFAARGFLLDRARRSLTE